LIKASAFPEPVEVIIYDLAGALKFDPVAHTFTIIELLGIANLKGFYIPLSMAGPTGKFTVERVKGVIFREACRAFQSKMNACPFVPKVGLDLSQTTS
jgi:hypothetical protein